MLFIAVATVSVVVVDAVEADEILVLVFDVYL